MLVLIATNELQGVANDDYSWTVEGELVTPIATECASGERCGCNRGFPGLASGSATTTAMIVDRPGITEDDLREAVHDWLDRGGWIELLEQNLEAKAIAEGHSGLGFNDLEEIDHMVDSIIDEHVVMIGEVCAAFPEGSIISRRGPLVSLRSHPFAA